ncbi:MAG: hypothetical protein JO299_09550 [Gammaproteobacteria bacterium]|nr:hypothetical protein [Gammaproteobacteria bacterium]
MMLRVCPKARCASTVVLICVCRPLSASEPQPAVLTNVTAASRAELSRVVSEAMHGTPVRLADDALTHASTLVVERMMPRDPAGLPLNGRELEKPQHFRLVKHASHCILVQESTGKRWRLHAATCVREETRESDIPRASYSLGARFVLTRASAMRVNSDARNRVGVAER